MHAASVAANAHRPALAIADRVRDAMIAASAP
jgi:hypothetical protein